MLGTSKFLFFKSIACLPAANTIYYHSNLRPFAHQRIFLYQMFSVKLYIYVFFNIFPHSILSEKDIVE